MSHALCTRSPAKAWRAEVEEVDINLSVDLLIFTGGIGENDAEARAAICRGLAWIGVSLDDARNRSASNPISASASRCSVRVLRLEEDEQIVRHTWELAATTG